MTNITASDGVLLYAEETGHGDAILFIHEFAGDCRSWEPQVRDLGRQYRCLVYNAHGYPPSDVPEERSAYSQSQAVDDAIAVLDHFEVDRAHVVGISMGGFCALHFGLRFPDRARSLVVAGCGYGAPVDKQEPFRRECAAIAAAFEREGAEAVAERYALGPARVQFQNKDPRGWAEFKRQLAEHSSEGSMLTMLGVQSERPSLYDLQEELSELTVPTLIVAGDEDEGCLEPDLMLKRTIPASGLAILPRTGHTCNLEDPAGFNRQVRAFFSAVENDAWGLRDPRSLATSTTGMDT